MRDKYTDAIRIGKISSINPEKATVQVTFEDRHDIVSGDLYIEVPKTLEDHYYHMPDIGEKVRVFFDPEAPTKGYVAGSYYCDTRIPPIADKDKTYVLFKDKTLIEYDRKLHKLTIKIPEAGDKSIEVETESDITVKTQGNLKAEVEKDIEIKTAKNIKVEAAENINVEASKNVTVDIAENLTIKAVKNIDVESEMNINIKATEPITIQSDKFVKLQGAVSELVVP